MMNPWAYDADGNLTAQAQQQEAARTRINSANATGGGNTTVVNPGALDEAGVSADQLHGRYPGEARQADDETTLVGTAFGHWQLGGAAQSALASWSQQSVAIAASMQNVSSNLRETARTYRDNENAVEASMKN
ncbi:hypothetical protein ACWGB8_29065 [Kitasatospora sp. NPDC054939]